jgi:hypothetical protein
LPGYAGGGLVGPIDVRANVDDAALIKALNSTTPGAGGPLGSGYQALFNTASAAFPGVILTSGYRPGDPGYHGKGRAADLGWAGNDARHLAAINRFWFDTYGSQLKELIYDGPFDDRPDIKNGVPHTYDAATRADHRTHVHTARANGGAFWPDHDFLVGENGPEIARFHGSGTIYPTGTAPAAMPGYAQAAGAAGIDYDRLAAAIARAIPVQERGPLFTVDQMGVVDGTPRDLAQELDYALRTRGV